MLGTSTAFAGLSCANQFAYKFSGMTNGATVGDGTVRPLAVVSGSGTHTLTVGTPVVTGTTYPTSINNKAAFNSYTDQRYWLSMGDTHNVGAGYAVTFVFDVDMYNVSFVLTDIDKSYDGSTNYIDQVWLGGVSAANTNAPFGLSSRGGVVGGGNGMSQSDALLGTGTAGTDQTNGSVTVTFAGPVKQFTIYYVAQQAGPGGRNGGTRYANPVTNQYIAVGDITCCS